MQDNHLDIFPDISQPPDHAAEGITNDYGHRMYNQTRLSSTFYLREFPGRDSISSTVSGYELPECSDLFFPFSSESIDESLGFTSEELGAQFPEGRLPFESTVSSDLPDHTPSPLLALTSNQTPLATPSRVLRRDSIASQTSCTSPDGHLHLSVTSPVHPQARSRPKNVSAPQSLSLDVPSGYDDVRSIPTANFSSSSGVTTSVLIPMTASKYDPEMERDLEEYSRALESVASESRMEGAQTFMSSFQISGESVASGKRKVKAEEGQNIEDGEFDLNAEFDFEAAFGDIIDIQAPPSQPATA